MSLASLTMRRRPERKTCLGDVILKLCPDYVTGVGAGLLVTGSSTFLMYIYSAYSFNKFLLPIFLYKILLIIATVGRHCERC